MKTKNKVLMVALMLVASIFCSSCIIIGDWDDVWGEYESCDVYYYSDVNNAWNPNTVTNVSNNNGYYCAESSNTEFLANTNGKTAYRWTRNDIETFLTQKGLNSNDRRSATNFFLSKRYNHAIIYIQSDSYTITALVR